MAEPSTTRVRAAHGDAWQTLAITTEDLPGVRLSATGLAHPQWNNGDVDDPALVDIDAVRSWYGALGVPWGMRVPAGASWPHGRFAVTVAVAALHGEVVATGSVTLSDGRSGRAGYVAGIAVLPQARRRGIGAALSAWLTQRAFGLGATLCHLHPDTDAAAAIYRRLGYAEVGGLDIYVDI